MQKIFSQKLKFKDENGEDYPKWENKRLKDVSSINRKSKNFPDNFIYIDLECVESGVLKKRQMISKEEAPSRAQRVLKNDDILFQTVRPYQKNNLFFNMADKENYVASTGYAQIRTKENPKFLYHFLHTERFVNDVLARCTGTSYPAINSKDLENIKIKFPSISEQNKIANLLSSIDKKLETINEELEINKKFKKGLLQQMFV